MQLYVCVVPFLRLGSLYFLEELNSVILGIFVFNWQFCGQNLNCFTLIYLIIIFFATDIISSFSTYAEVVFCAFQVMWQVDLKVNSQVFN